MRIITPQPKSNPKLADRVINAVNAQLMASLPWLNQAFPRSWKIRRVVNNKIYVEPTIYCIGDSGNEYESVMPSSDLGNYSFFVLQDPSEVRENNVVEMSFSIIFWFDLRTCFGVNNRRDTENLKHDVLKCLTKEVWVKDAGITVDCIYEDASNVFKGYTIDEVENQYMMHPYGAMRVDGKMTINECL